MNIIQNIAVVITTSIIISTAISIALVNALGIRLVKLIYDKYDEILNLLKCL